MHHALLVVPGSVVHHMQVDTCCWSRGQTNMQQPVCSCQIASRDLDVFEKQRTEQIINDSFYSKTTGMTYSAIIRASFVVLSVVVHLLFQAANGGAIELFL